MLTERELKTLLAELQERHPLKDGKSITLLFGGWGFASSDLKDRSIVMPHSWAECDAWCYFALIHEYAHFLSEDQVSGLRKEVRNLHNYLAHDKAFKQTENLLMAEYGIQFKRFIIYPRKIETPLGNWSPNDTLTLPSIFVSTLGINLWGSMVALILLKYLRGIETPWVFWPFMGILAFVILADNHGSQIHQALVRRKYRKTGIHRSL